MKYIVVGGVPFTGYTGVETYTSIIEIGRFNTMDEAELCISKNWDSCGGLLHIIDAEIPEK